jgi:hypothetical protein
MTERKMRELVFGKTKKKGNSLSKGEKCFGKKRK